MVFTNLFTCCSFFFKFWLQGVFEHLQNVYSTAVGAYFPLRILGHELNVKYQYILRKVSLKRNSYKTRLYTDQLMKMLWPEALRNLTHYHLLGAYYVPGTVHFTGNTAPESRGRNQSTLKWISFKEAATFVGRNWRDVQILASECHVPMKGPRLLGKMVDSKIGAEKVQEKSAIVLESKEMEGYMGWRMGQISE